MGKIQGAPTSFGYVTEVSHMYRVSQQVLDEKFLAKISKIANLEF